MFHQRQRRFCIPAAVVHVCGHGGLFRMENGPARDGAFAGWLLGYYGFQANVTQNGSTQTGIRMMVSIYPAIGALVSGLFMLVYPLKENFLASIESDLAARRAASGKPEPAAA